MLVAHFERFLKNLHEDLLQDEPKNLANLEAVNKNSREKFTDAEIFKDLQRFKRGRIQWQVEELDRKRMNDRAKYFKKLGIEWGTKDETDLVQQLSDSRNMISHESPHEVVPDPLRIQAEKVFLK